MIGIFTLSTFFIFFLKLRKKEECKIDTKEAAWYTFGKKYEELTLASDFLFCKIMQEPELCKEMLQRIMGIKLGKVEVINSQNRLTQHSTARASAWIFTPKMKPEISTILESIAIAVLFL